MDSGDYKVCYYLFENELSHCSNRMNILIAISISSSHSKIFPMKKYQKKVIDEIEYETMVINFQNKQSSALSQKKNLIIS